MRGRGRDQRRHPLPQCITHRPRLCSRHPALLPPYTRVAQYTRFQDKLLLQDVQQFGRGEHALPDLTVSAGRPDAPLVILIQGIGGNAQHWSDPLSLNPTDTWLFDLNRPPAPGTVGLGSSPTYQPGSVTAWCQLLANNQISYVTWSQSQPADLLQYAVQEAVAVLSGIEQRLFAPYEQDVSANGGQAPPLILLCHSRGGLVARAALKQLGSEGVPHLRKVITVCTPHHGSYMPRLAGDYNTTLSNALDFSTLGQSLPSPIRHFLAGTIDPMVTDLANRVRLAMLHSFGTLAQGPGFDELDPDSAMIQGVAQEEQPLPGVQYYSIGGALPTFINFYFCQMGRSFHVLSTASTFLVEQLARIPGVATHYGGLAEIDQGDSAVAPSSSQWPAAFGATHQTARVNHMQALVDPTLQQSVLAIVQA